MRERLIPVAFGLTVLGILGVGSLAYFVMSRVAEAEAWVVHTAVAIGDLERLHLTLVETESAGRAFLVTGQGTFRAAYDKRLASIDDQLQAFRTFTTDNREQQASLDLLGQQVDRRFAYLGGQMELRASKGFDALVQSTLSLGVQEMVGIRETIQKMKNAENALLRERTGRREVQNAWLQVGLAALIAAGTLLMGGIFSYMNHLWTLRRQAETKALHLAHHDTLTGLPNRRLLQDRMQIALAGAARAHRIVAVLCLDLDGFKSVNDTLGHDGGDDLLRQVAQRLQGLLRAQDTVARLGGDEFVVALSDLEAPEQATLVAEKIIQAITSPFTIKGQQALVGTSVGISLYPEHGATQEELFKRGDMALYEAKAAGKRRYALASGGSSEGRVHAPSRGA